MKPFRYCAEQDDYDKRPDSDFLVVNKNGERHLPVKKFGKLDHKLMGHAWAALHGGFFGKAYEGPGKEQALSELKSLYKKEGLPLPGGEDKAEPEKVSDKPADEKQPDAETEPEPEDEPESETTDSEIGEWVQVGKGWVVKFQVNGNDYVASFHPLDEKEKHWKFTYFRSGQRDSADIKKFGPQDEWKDIWETLIKILKDFVRIFKPITLKFIGMSASKRPTHYRELYKIYVKHFLNSFKKQGYQASFDEQRFDNTPSFIIRRKQKEETEKE